jgi:hypothetical protein
MPGDGPGRDDGGGEEAGWAWELLRLVLRFRGLNHIDASMNLVLRSALLRASRRTATSETEPAAILRDGASRLLRMRSVGFKLRPPDPIGFMESIY